MALWDLTTFGRYFDLKNTLSRSARDPLVVSVRSRAFIRYSKLLIQITEY